MSKLSKILSKLNEKAFLPTPWLNALEWACADALTLNPDLLANLEMKEVSVDELVPTQLARDEETVAKYAKDGVFDGSLCFSRGGTTYIYDGHHRFSSAQRAGKEKIKAYVIDLGDGEVSLKRFARKIKQSPEDIVKSMSNENKRHYEGLV